MIKDNKIVRTVMRSFKLDEISGVDRPAQQAATVAILKRNSAPLEKIQMSMAITTMTGGHAHLITMGGGEYTRRAGNTDYVDGHSHSWMMTEAGDVIVAHAMGHNHGIEVISKGEATPDAVKRLLGKSDTPAPSQVTNPGEESAERIGNEDHMTPEEMKAAEAAAAAQKAELEKLAKRAERAERIAGLSDAHRAHFRLLKGEEAEAFLAGEDDERNEIVRKHADADKVVYTSMDGTSYRKSDDPRMISLAKQMDEEKKKRMMAEEKAKKSELEKLAKEFKHLPGTDEERMTVLKAINALEGEERESALKILKAQDAALSGAFQRRGRGLNKAEIVEEETQTDPLSQMASEIAKRDSITFEQAYTKALGTPEGQKAYEAHVSRSRGAVAD